MAFHQETPREGDRDRALSQEEGKEEASNDVNEGEEQHQQQENHADTVNPDDPLCKTMGYLAANPCMAKLLCCLNANYSLVVLFGIHTAVTLVIWTHFAQIKFHQQQQSIPTDDSLRNWKVWGPTLEFGTMHAILFQLALLPMTMCRVSLTYLARFETIHRFLPLERIQSMHNYLGYLVVGLVSVATLFFFVFFGYMCAAGEDAFCDKFTTEIMGTGYAIITLLVLVGVTSFQRYTIPHEVFYVVHHLVFLMYAVTIAHTLDGEQRKGTQSRHQTFRWFTASLLYYVCDRATMHLLHKYHTTVDSASQVTLEGRTRESLLVLKVKRPPLLQFEPGQYVFLKVGSLGFSWHPFSIASDPRSSLLEFYIESQGKGSWTDQLARLVTDAAPGWRVQGHNLPVQVMGPFGSPLVRKSGHYSRILAIGSGTGVVPHLSLFQQHLSRLADLDPWTYAEYCEEEHERSTQAKEDLRRQKLPLMSKLCHRLGFSDANDTRTRASRWQPERGVRLLVRAKVKLIFVAALSSLAVALIGMTVSWNSLPFTASQEMMTSIYVICIVIQSAFTVFALFIWPSDSLWTLVDLGVVCATPIADLYLFREYERAQHWQRNQVVFFGLLSAFMAVRFWVSATGGQPNRRSVYSSERPAIPHFHLIWVTKSKTFISVILAEMQKYWDRLERRQQQQQQHGSDFVKRHCCLSIYCTDTTANDPEESMIPEQTHVGAPNTRVFLGRPDFQKILTESGTDLAQERAVSRTLIAFFGSSQVSQVVAQHSTLLDVASAIILSSDYYDDAAFATTTTTVDFYAETYGRGRRKRET